MTPDSARDDLAFMRALVQPDDRWQHQFGAIYAFAGLCYSVQMLLHLGQFAGVAPSTGLGAQAIGWGPTAVLVVFLVWATRRDNTRPSGAVSRAIGSVFGAVGLTNVALALSIGSVALRLHSQTIWLLYPVVVMILQGLAWMVAFMLRRRAWLFVVAAGWFAVGVAMAASIDHLLTYALAAFAGVFFFMLAPGLYIMRQARAA
jgi:hypothetical protein